jgi:hypothetical protein
VILVLPSRQNGSTRVLLRSKRPVTCSIGKETASGEIGYNQNKPKAYYDLHSQTYGSSDWPSVLAVTIIAGNCASAPGGPIRRSDAAWRQRPKRCRRCRQLPFLHRFTIFCGSSPGRFHFRLSRQYGRIVAFASDSRYSVSIASPAREPAAVIAARTNPPEFARKAQLRLHFV